jgi:hypothetical protein
VSDPGHGADASRRLSHYDLLELIGTGGMGTVYRAIDRRSGVVVALKVVHPHLQDDVSYVERFRREAHLASLLRSPYVVHTLDNGFDNGRYFMVMEYVEGLKLSEILRSGPLAPLQALAITSQIGMALAEAELNHVVHRDIKPDNIILTAHDRSVKVLDFGIARQTMVGGVTVTGLFVGTVAYSAPEQFEGHADVRTDIYALGVMLFQMLAGDLPFKAATPTGLMRLHEDAPPPLERLGALPEPVIDVVRRCMEKKPEGRYQHASELLAAIEVARQSLTGAQTEAWMTEATSVLVTSKLREQAGTEIAQRDAERTRVQEAGTAQPPGSAAGSGAPVEPAGGAAIPTPMPSAPSTPLPVSSDESGGGGGGGGNSTAVPAAQGGGGRGVWMLLIGGGVVAAIAAVIVGVLVFAGGDDGPSEREVRIATRTAEAIKEDTREARTEEAETEEADRTPTPDPETPTPDSGVAFANTGTWSVTFTAISNDCPFGLPAGQSVETSFDLFESPFNDGFLDAGETVSITEPAGNFIEDTLFTLPEFIFTWHPPPLNPSIVNTDIFTTFTFSSFDTASVNQQEFYDIDEDGDGISDTTCLLEVEAQ